MSEPRRRKRASQWPFAESSAEGAAPQPPVEADDPLLHAAEDAVVADANEMPVFKTHDGPLKINIDLLSDELDGTPSAPAPQHPPAAQAAPQPVPTKPTPAQAAVQPAAPQPSPAQAAAQPTPEQSKPQPAAPQAAPVQAASAAPADTPSQPVWANATVDQPSPAPASREAAAQPSQPAADPPAAAHSAADLSYDDDLESLLAELADEDVADVDDPDDPDDPDDEPETTFTAPPADSAPVPSVDGAPTAEHEPVAEAQPDRGDESFLIEEELVALDIDDEDPLDEDPYDDVPLSDVPLDDAETPDQPGSALSIVERPEEIPIDAGPAWSTMPIAQQGRSSSPPPPDSALVTDERFWSTLGDDQDDDDELVAPVFTPVDPTDENPLRSMLRTRAEPAPIARDLIDRLRAQASQRISAQDAAGDEEPTPADRPAPLGLDDDHSDDVAPEEWAPPIYVAARAGAFAGPQTLSLLSPNLQSDVDELNDALAAFSELQEGQKGFIRVSMRAYPEFKNISTAWVQQRKHGMNPDAEKPGPAKLVVQWLRYGLQRLWFEGNKSSRYLGGSTPPLAPGKSGDAKPLPANARSEEEKAAEKDATQKARDSTHFEATLRIGVVTKNDDAQEAERIADEVTAGFEIYATEHQQLVWRQADPYDTCIGYMPTRRPERVDLSLSAGEMGELARVPDDLTRPHGVRIRHSSFKQLMPGNRILIDNPYEPTDGVIPLGVLSPRSEDAQVIGIRNSELDRHMFFCGRTGTGKSEMMKWLIFGVAKADYPLVVIDPHGALVDDLVNTLIVNCPERIADLVVADLGDPDHPVALNPLDIHSKEQIEPTVGAVMEMLAKQMSLGQGAPRASNYAVQALAALTEANLHLSDPETKTSLLHIVRFFQDEEFRRLIMAFCTNAAALEMFDPETGPYEQMNDKARIDQVMPVIRAFQQLSRSESFSAVFSAGENRLDFARLIMDKKIVLIKLARFAHQKKLGEFIGALVIPYLLASMDEWGRRKDPITGQQIGRGCRIFVDEAPTLIGPESAAIQLLAEARKWDFGMVFASQYLSQFDPTVMKAALANTATKVTLALDPDNTTQIAKAIAGTSGMVGPNDVANLPDYHMYANVLLPTADGGKATSGVFSAACLKPINCDLQPEHVDLRTKVLERSWTLLCNDRQEIVAKQKTIVEDIKATLLTKLQERLEAGNDPLAGHDPGGQNVDYGIDLDGGGDFTGW